MDVKTGKPRFFLCIAGVLLIFLSLAFFSGEVRASKAPADSLHASDHEQGDSILQFNRFGSFGSFLNGIQARIKTDNYHLFGTYSYRNYNGYLAHSNADFHTLNLMVETTPTKNTRLQIIGNYLNGLEKKPGSLTKSEFESNPYSADPMAVGRDEKRITSKGELQLNYLAAFGKKLHQKIEISGNGQIEYFIRTTKEYKVTTRYVFGLNARYVNNGRIWNRKSEFSAGGELFHQPERKEEFENLGAKQSDWLEQLETEKTSIISCFVSENVCLVENRLSLMVHAKYNHVIYSVAEEMAPSLSDTKRYSALTPTISLHYSVIPAVTLYASYERNFRNPTDKELESPNQASLYNQDLTPQTSTTLNAGVNGTLKRDDEALFFNSLKFEMVLFHRIIHQQILPYEIFGDEYYRNATKTTGYGIELKSRLKIYTDLSLSVDYTYSHFIYNAYTADSWETDSSGTITIIPRDFAGNFESNLPRNNLFMELAYSHPAGKKTDIFARLSYQYFSGRWVDDLNSGKTNPANLVNTVVGVDVKLGHFLLSASARVNNILDQVYVNVATANSADKRFYNAGAPRNFGGSVNIGYVF
ncbi:MAG: TonB-dependent receptor domain-containing protein [Bacteroidales bacterium]